MISKKIVKPKKRIEIDAETRNRIREYLEKTDYPYLIICMLAFNCLLRPSEISSLRVKNVILDKQLIFIPGEISKNRKDRYATIPGSMGGYLEKLIITLPESTYIFSKHDFLPGAIPTNTKEIGRRWIRLRKELKLPENMQFYSLRDSGIVQMLRDGVSPEQVRDQADHSSLEITNRYVRIASPGCLDQVKNKSTLF